MAKLPEFKRVNKEDFDPEYQGLVERMGYIINIFMEQVVQAFNKNIDFNNLNQEYRDIEVTVNASGIPTMTTSFKNGLNTRVSGMICIRAENLTNTATYPTGAILLAFAEENKIVNIKHITGLQANQKYKLRVLSIG